MIFIDFYFLGGDPSHDVCCPDVRPSSDWWKRGRHFPAQDQVSGRGPQGAASWHVNPCELQAQPNKPPYTNSGCTHLMNITVTAVDVLLCWLTRKHNFWRTVGLCNGLLSGWQWLKWFGAVVEKCRGLGFLWCWSLDQKKKRIFYNSCAPCHFLHTTETFSTYCEMNGKHS